MKTLLLHEPGDLRLIDTAPPPSPASDEAQVRVRRVGICGTDLHAYGGRQPFFTYPRILGHELAVEVVALGADAGALGLRIGDRCAVNPYLNCGECISCRRGKPNCCVKMRVLGVHTDGGMCEMINVPARKLHKIEASDAALPDSHVAIVEMLAVCAHAVARAQIEAGENVLVIGAGPIGLGVMAFAQIAAQAAGGEVVALEVNPFRREFCTRVLGVQHALDGQGDTAEQLRALLGGDLPTVVFDATGNAASMRNALRLMAHGGKLVYVGLVQGETTLDDPQCHAKETTLLRTRNALDSDFRRVIALLTSRHLDPSAWITHHATPEQIVGAFPRWLDPATGVVKASLAF